MTTYTDDFTRGFARVDILPAVLPNLEHRAIDELADAVIGFILGGTLGAILGALLTLTLQGLVPFGSEIVTDAVMSYLVLTLGVLTGIGGVVAALARSGRS